MDARPEQALVRIDVSDPDHDLGVHQQQLDTYAAAARGPVEELRREPIAERFHAELREQRVPGDVAGFPQHHAEAPRIAQAQRGGAENEVHVIVIAWGVPGSTARRLPDIPSSTMIEPAAHWNSR